MNPTQTYTASQFARACDVKPQTIRQVLGNVPCDQTLQISGNEVSAWRVCSLPVTWQCRLEAAAERKGFRNVEQLLTDPARTSVEDAPVTRVTSDRFFEIRQAVGTGKLSAAEQLRVLRLAVQKYDALIDLGESQRVVAREILNLL